MLKERFINGHKNAGQFGVPPRTHPYTLACMHKSLMVRPIVVNPKAKGIVNPFLFNSREI